MDGGASVSDALSAALAADPMSVLRQVAVVGADGAPAVHTGAMCIDHAGHLVGDGFVVAANMMSTPDVWPAMADAFVTAVGPLERRMHAALRAGEHVGGDERGRMSGAILVVEGTRPEASGQGTVVDLRVDRSDDPLGELGRLLDAADAYADFGRAADQLFGGDAATALATVDRALGLLPDEENLLFLRAGALLASGEVDAGEAELRSLVGRRPTWEVVIRGFAAAGLVAAPDGRTIDDLLA
jgi:uncharacterized Ntn-hydrolase superfamily protein